MTKLLADILAANAAYRANPPVDYSGEDHKKSKMPSRQLAILTCMDTRLVDFLEPALGLKRGEAKVLKTAGNCLSGPFDSMVRSLLVCIYELGVREIFVIGHHECGMAATTAAGLSAKMIERGVPAAAIKMVQHEMELWADGFSHPEQNVKDTVAQLRANPLIAADVVVHGLIFHPRTAELAVIDEG